MTLDRTHSLRLLVSDSRRTHLIARSQAHAEWQALALDKTEGNMEYFNKILNASLQEEPPRSSEYYMVDGRKGYLHQPYRPFITVYEQHIGRPTASRSEWDRLLTEFLTIKETKQSSKLRHFLDVCHFSIYLSCDVYHSRDESDYILPRSPLKFTQSVWFRDKRCMGPAMSHRHPSTLT
jgi:hypothetical protein